MTRPQLTVVGAVNLDQTARVSRAPGPGETVADGKLTLHAGGKGANQAVAAARLGADVHLIGALGDDPEGHQLRSSIAAAGVDTAGLQSVPYPTGTALIVVDDQGENSIVVCPGANEEIVLDEVSIEPQSAVLAQLEVPLAVVERAIASTEGFVALNASPVIELPDWLTNRVDLFIVNESEFAAQPQLRVANFVAVTYGARGAELLRNGKTVARASAAATSVVSTVGAGDAFAAALTIGLLRADEPELALARACAVGAAAVADPGSQPELQPLNTYSASNQL